MKQIKLDDLSPGTLFRYNETIALKTEYYTDDGRPECYIIGSGEFFCGGANSIDELLNLLVKPIKIKDICQEK